MKAGDLLEGEGIDARVINARFAKPLDEEAILAAARETGGIVTAEENVRAGGFGEAVLALLADNGVPEALLLNLTMPDDIVDHGPQKVYRGVYDLDGDGIARRAMEVLKDRGVRSARGALRPPERPRKGEAGPYDSRCSITSHRR